MDLPSDGGAPASRFLTSAAGSLLVAIAYVAFAILGRKLASYDIVTAVWPPTGFAVAALTLCGPRFWPGVALGELLIVTVPLPHVPLPLQLTPLAAVAMTAGSTLEALVGAFLLRRFAACATGLCDVRSVVVLLLVPVLGCSISATTGTLGLLSMQAIRLVDVPNTWWTWWVGNALGVIVLTPLLCTAAAGRRGDGLRLGGVSEAVALVLLGGLTAAYAMFGAFPEMPRSTREAYLLSPFLLWAALRFGPRGAAIGVFTVSTLALVSTRIRLAHATDLFVVGMEVLRLQVFVGVIGASILTLAASAAERRRAFLDLEAANERLEAEVEARTRALASTNLLLVGRNEALARANVDLDSFAARAAHDLRAPVRAVRGFVAILRDTQGERLDGDGMVLVDRIQRASARMGAIIDGLLAIAQVDRQGIVAKEIDVGALARRVVAEVDPDRTVEVRIGRLPPCVADPNLLEVVFTNLVQNALKFSRGAPHPLVEIAGERGEGASRYWVRDNGVGFDAKDTARLFRAFSRLHGGPYEGSGLGLATVRRIVELHGGQVWAEGAVGQGATFGFTIPDVVPAPTGAKTEAVQA